MNARINIYNLYSSHKSIPEKQAQSKQGLLAMAPSDSHHNLVIIHF